jgi:hypothetical protein
LSDWVKDGNRHNGQIQLTDSVVRIRETHLASNRFAITLSSVFLICAWTAGIVNAQLGGAGVKLPDDSLKTTLPNGSDSRYWSPQIIAPAIAVEAILRATAVPTIAVRRTDLSPGTARKLFGLTERLSEVDTQIAGFQRKVGAASFQNLLKLAGAFASGGSPGRLSAGLSQDEIHKMAGLWLERQDINRQIWGIEHPGGVMRQGSLVELTRSAEANNNYQVYRSVEPTTGAVACHEEERTHREYRMTYEPNGFDGAGTPLYRNVYHAFPKTELVRVCP